MSSRRSLVGSPRRGISHDKLEGMILRPLRSWLAGCISVYVDVGSNIGQRLDALFGGRPDEFFDDCFSNRSAACALAVEPNPLHRAILRRKTSAYRAHGRAVRVLYVAVSNATGTAPFWNDRQPEMNHWGASLFEWAGSASSSTVVPTVAFRTLLEQLPPRSACVKMDAEGIEYDVLNGASAALCAKVRRIDVEWHDKVLRLARAAYQRWASQEARTAEEEALRSTLDACGTRLGRISN